MALVLVPAFVGVVAPHEHDEGHTHDTSGGVEAASHEHAEDDEHADGEDAAHTHAAPSEAPSEEVAGLAADPRLAGADTSHATEAQLTAAIELVDGTRAGTSVQLTTTAAAEAAGYVWIGDGRRVGGFQHYVNRDLMRDGKILDSDAVESLVFENTASGPVLVSAMYLLEPGATMADVPDVAGDLTVWHDHQNLCWDETGQRLAGVVVNGVCRPGGVQRGTTPMLHVWLADHQCGPFAGIEGHGNAECGAHEH
jgi:hypothetical protein